MIGSTGERMLELTLGTVEMWSTWFTEFGNTPDGFAEKYLAMLRAGGSKRHKELLAPFGLDASDPGFWRQGLGVIEGFIDELETL